MSLDDILKKIEKDYSEKEKEILQNGERDYKEKLEKMKQDMSQRSENDKKMNEAELRSKYDRMYMSENSALKLEINKFKSEYIDKLFSLIYENMTGLSKNEYQKIFLGFIDKEELKHINKCRLGKNEDKIDKDFIEKLTKTGITMEKDDDFEHGVIFSGDNFNINLSLNEIVKKIREKYYARIVNTVFNE